MPTYGNEEQNEWLVRHPTWVRFLGWIGIPLLLASSIYVVLIPVISERYEPVVILSCVFLGLFPLYMCVQALKVFPFMRADVEVNDNGFSIFYPNGKSETYSWSKIKRIKHYTTSQVLELVDMSEKTVLAVMEQAWSYEKFVELANKNVKS
ncbi:hypothetical protein SAMN05216562_1652 [Microbulbifer marinus]|uniref:YcxB-like protein n=1 Tax=Microbulbifer marinus TaxID=658218 RepID=A0A1H3YCR4_9GAMM|nr:hypothetical protein SAMN05216562_1652 [Microbulbifer marinus]